VYPGINANEVNTIDFFNAMNKEMQRILMKERIFLKLKNKMHSKSKRNHDTISYIKEKYGLTKSGGLSIRKFNLLLSDLNLNAGSKDDEEIQVEDDEEPPANEEIDAIMEEYDSVDGEPININSFDTDYTLYTDHITEIVIRFFREKMVKFRKQLNWTMLKIIEQVRAGSDDTKQLRLNGED